MNVLQHPIFVVSRRTAEIGVVARIPGVAEVANRKLALQQSLLKVETDHDVKVVGHLVRVGANKGSLNLVDGSIEGF